MRPLCPSPQFSNRQDLRPPELSLSRNKKFQRKPQHHATSPLHQNATLKSTGTFLRNHNYMLLTLLS